MIISPIDNSNKDLIKQAHDNLEKFWMQMFLSIMVV